MCVGSGALREEKKREVLRMLFFPFGLSHAMLYGVECVFFPSTELCRAPIVVYNDVRQALEKNRRGVWGPFSQEQQAYQHLPSGILTKADLYRGVLILSPARPITRFIWVVVGSLGDRNVTTSPLAGSELTAAGSPGILREVSPNRSFHYSFSPQRN